MMMIRIVYRLPGWGERASTGLESGLAAWGKLVGERLRGEWVFSC